MSILDFTTGLFRDPVNLRSFVEDPNQALADAGLPDATPEQVHDLLPVVAESMPPDHPLQAVVHSDDPLSALQALDIDDLIAETHDHHREVERIEKALGSAGDVVSLHVPAVECRPTPEGDEPGEPIHVGNWELNEENDKGLGDIDDDSLTPKVDGDAEPGDDFPEPAADDQPSHHHAVAEGLVDTDFGAVAWGKAVE
jgi:hypothetical protein